MSVDAAPPRTTPGPPAPAPSVQVVAARVAAAAAAQSKKTPPRAPRRKPLGPVQWLGYWLTDTKPPGRPDLARVNPRALLVATSLQILTALLLGFVVHMTLLGTFSHNRDQQVAYDDLRLTLAEGTTPVGPVAVSDGTAPVVTGPPLGTPIARLSIPAIGVKEVVLEGTTGGVLRSGVGHRRDTVYPGQAGTSILMGRRMSYGGPFNKLGNLSPGDEIKTVTGQGEATFRVAAVRTAGQNRPPATTARLTLITTAGSPFSPKDLRYVDADLVSAPFVPVTPLYSVTTLPRAELPLQGDPGALGRTIGWGIPLIAAAIGTTWLRLRWGRWQAWAVGVPTLAFLGLNTADKVAEMLPNLL